MKILQPFRGFLEFWQLGRWAVRKLLQTAPGGRQIALTASWHAWALVIASSIATVSGSVVEGEERYELFDGSVVSPLEIFQECDVCPEMVVLPMGSFIMGGPIGDSINGLVFLDGKLKMVEVGHPAIGADERPLHGVEIDIPVAMGRNEVTYDEWMACVDDGGCRGYVPENVVISVSEDRRPVDTIVRGDHPVIDVSFLDAQSYVAWLNRKVGTDAYRLPTEAEWEYAARSGTQTRFAQGDELTAKQANFYGAGTAQLTGEERPDLLSRGVPVPVHQLDAANRWGLRHMSGNVVEQTRSCYTEHYAGWTTSSEWLRQSAVVTCKRVYRGGAYNTAMDYLRVASRGSGEEDFRSQYSGFRVLRQLN